VSIKKNKTEDLDDKCKVAVINYLLNTLFCRVDIFLAGKKITPSIPTHGWRAIFKVFLNVGKDAKSTHFEMSCYKKDTAGEMDSLEKNAGIIARRIKDSKPFELYGRLHSDISFQNIINNEDMVLRLIRNQSSFCLMGDGVHNYELFIDEATLYMRQEKIIPAVMLQHAMA
jgi:hypothetical protein